jgi:hypothetical protein
MFGFKKLLGKHTGNAQAEMKKVVNRDLMQAIVGGGLLIAAADGEISPEMCAVVANDLEPLLDKMTWEAHGHIARDGGFRAVLQRFIDGCRAAHAADEPLLFR